MMSMLYHALLLGYYLPYPFMTTLMLAVVFLSNIHIYDLIMEGGGGQDNHKLPEEHLERTWIDPLVGGGVESGDNRLGWSERRKYPPALNLAREQEIYEASLCAYNTMLLV